MGKLNLFQVILLVINLSLIECQRKEVMRVYSDFNSPEDVQFFSTTLPWLVDNIGPNLEIKYYFRDNGRNVGPRLCALDTMRWNTYLQADYLRCEIQGNTSNTCRRLLPINNVTYNRCLRNRVDRMIMRSQREFNRLRSMRMPAVVLDGWWRMENLGYERMEFDVLEPNRLLSNICWGFGTPRPEGCIRPLPPPGSTGTQRPPNDFTSPLPNSNSTSIIFVG